MCPIRCVASACFLAALVLAPAACKSESREQHESLAASLRAPVTTLCEAYHPVEAGGCSNNLCRETVNTHDAYSALKAGAAFAATPTFPDPRTEVLLADLRTAGRAVATELGAACTTDARLPVRQGEVFHITPEIERCSAAVNAATPMTHLYTPAIGGLMSAVDRLAADVSKRTGAVMPSMATTCPQDS
jgi:hypothetical protein